MCYWLNKSIIKCDERFCWVYKPYWQTVVLKLSTYDQLIKAVSTKKMKTAESLIFLAKFKNLYIS